MRAINSTFPNGWAGAGLLLLRLAGGASSASAGAAQLWGGAGLLSGLGSCAQILTGSLLLIGFWTPVVGILLGVGETLRAVVADRIDVFGLVRAAIALGLAMVGPGARSIDARLFGRRRIDVATLQD
jgi:putative oxidoreductase